MGATSVYLVEVGALVGDRVVYDAVAAYSTRKLAEAMVRQAKATDSYRHQYTRAVGVTLNPGVVLSPSWKPSY